MKLQEMLFDQAAMLPLVYPWGRQAVNTTDWTGWLRVPPPDGPTIYLNENVDTYVNVRPVVATESASTGGSSTSWIVLGVVAALVAVVIVVLVVRRTRRAEVE